MSPVAFLNMLFSKGACELTKRWAVRSISYPVLDPNTKSLVFFFFFFLLNSSRALSRFRLLSHIVERNIKLIVICRNTKYDFLHKKFKGEKKHRVMLLSSMIKC